MDSPHFVSTLTLACLQLQESLENSSLTLSEKNELIFKHLNWIQEQDREPIPEFGAGWDWLNTSRNLTVKEDLTERITVMDFFTYCCINCVHILPDLHDLEKLYPSDSGVIVVGIHSAKFDNEKVSENIQAALQRYDIKHPVVNDSQAVFWNKLAITCWPTLLILDPDAKPLFIIVGEGHRDVLFYYIENALKFYSAVVKPWTHPVQIGRGEIYRSHLRFPTKLCLTPDQHLVISDAGHHRIILLNLQGQIKATVGGPDAGFRDGSFSTARFCQPQGLTFRPPASIFVADTGNHSIREIDLTSRSVRTVAGTGRQSMDKEGGRVGPEQGLASPKDLCIVPSVNSDFSELDVLLIANTGNHQIWALALLDTTWWKQVPLESGKCVRVAGSGAEENRNNSYPMRAAFAQPSGLCSALIVGPPSQPDQRIVFIADSESSSIRQMLLKDGQIKALVGGHRDPLNLFEIGDQDNEDDPKRPAKLAHPLAVCWDPVKQLVYVADTFNHKVKAVNPLNRTCATLVGPGSRISDVELSEPSGLCLDSANRFLYIADTNHHRICRVQLDLGIIETMEVVDEERPEDVCDLPQPPDFFQEIELDRSGSQLCWALTFKCPPRCKWAAEAPHRWKLEAVPVGVRVESLNGSVIDGSLQIHLRSESGASHNGVGLLRVSLFLCTQETGVCTSRTLYIQLNIQLTDKKVNSNIEKVISLPPLT